MGSLRLHFDGIDLGDPSQSGIGEFSEIRVCVHLLSFSGPYHFCTINEPELVALQTGLHAALVDGDSFSVIRWVSGSSKLPWLLTDTAEEVLELSS